MSPITIAVAGGTGRLGKLLTTALLRPVWYPSEIGKVVVLTRSPSSPAAHELKAAGATIVDSSSITAEHLQNTDVLVNATSGYLSLDEKNAYAKAAVDAGVKLYFAPQWGSDYRLLLDDLPAFRMKNIDHEKYAREIGSGKMKVVSVFNGEFMELVREQAPLMGIDVPNRHFEAVGDLNAKAPTTSSSDIGNAVARASTMAISDPNSIPDYLVLRGDAFSIQDIADLVTKITGKPVKTSVVDTKEFRARLDGSNPKDFFNFIRLERDSGIEPEPTGNEIVNPGQKYWTWKTIEQHLQETRSEWE